MALDTTSATPLFQQLAEELRKALRAGVHGRTQRQKRWQT